MTKPKSPPPDEPRWQNVGKGKSKGKSKDKSKDKGGKDTSSDNEQSSETEMPVPTEESSPE